eukprot:353045-Chlamydomonas_euryale.AAC.9
MARPQDVVASGCGGLKVWWPQGVVASRCGLQGIGFRGGHVHTWSAAIVATLDAHDFDIHFSDLDKTRCRK